MKGRLTPLQVLVHAGAWFPLLHLAFDFFTGRMSINPIQEIEQRTGLTAILLLVLSLACTPLNTVLGWHEAIQRRRALGLYAFLYAAIHLAVYVGLDYGFVWGQIWTNILTHRYLLVGALSFLMLVPLALTSFRSSMKSLGKNWKRLHNLVYLIAPLVVLHDAWSKKGDLFHLAGDILQPLTYGLIVILLLALRVPFLRKTAGSLRWRVPALVKKITGRFHKPTTTRSPCAGIKTPSHRKKVHQLI